MFAFTGNRSAFMVNSLSAFFVCGARFFYQIFCLTFYLIGIAALAGCGEEPQSNSSAVLSDSELSTSSEPPICSPFAKTEVVTVSHVHDGDTLKLSDGRKVRLIGVNATEMAKKSGSNQPFSLQAKKSVQAFISHAKKIHLLIDVENKDHYGRWLGHIYNEAGENLEQSLLRQGLAYHVAIPPNLTLAECLDQAEQQAQDKQLGLWSDRGIPSVKAKWVDQGGFQRVRGKVTIAGRDKHWHLKLDNYFTVMLYSEHQHRFSKHWFKQLQGKTIEVQGWVYLSKSQKSKGQQSKGKWRMKLETPYGVELL